MAETRTLPAMGSDKRGAGVGQWFALAGTVVAVAVIVALVASWPSHGDRTLSVAETAPAADAATVAAPARAGSAPSAAPSAKRDVHVRSCGSIFGAGVPHRVMSSATAGAPAGCGEAHSVLLAALNGGGASVAGWHCARSPDGRTLEACTSAGGRRITARD